MGGCTNSKYAVDEDKVPKEKKDKKSKNKKVDTVEAAAVETPAVVAAEPLVNGIDSKPNDEANKLDSAAKDIEYIDKEEAEKQAAAAAAAAASTAETTKPDNDDTKKEVTTYQTTVVKHTQKEGDELLQHLKEEAFRTLQNLLKQQEAGKQTTRSTTASTANSAPQTTTESSAQQEDIVEQIKAQVINSVGKNKQDVIYEIIDNGTDLIKQNKVKNMNELQACLEQMLPDTETDKNSELIKKVINATTGFLTAKGTEAGALLSNILANVSNGLTGVMNETEKTTVKVTRTVTEQILSGGQLKEVTRVVTSTEPAGAGAQNIQDVLKNLQNGLSIDGTSFSTICSQPTITISPLASPTKTVTSGNTTTLSSTLVNETHETVQETKSEDFTKTQAEHVVKSAVNAAVEKVIDESSTQSSSVQQTNSKLTNGNSSTSSQEVVTNGHHFNSVQQSESLHEQFTEENIKIEEESSVKYSTTKIILNDTNTKLEEQETLLSSDLDQVQTQFYKHGKESAEEVVKKIYESSMSESASVVSNSATATSVVQLE